MIRRFEESDLEPCVEIFISVYNNEIWQNCWSFEKAKEYSALLNAVECYIKEKGLAGFTLLTNRYTPAPDFYQKNGFSVGEHVLFMYKVV